MTSSQAIVISASRRTDIPAFYMEEFMEQIHRGYFERENPYNQKISRISSLPEDIHTIVFWSKNFGSFIEKRYGEILKKMGYHLFFNFTINSESPLLEPRVPPLIERLEQLSLLCRHFGPDTVTWRFDPICYYRTSEENSLQNNMSDFIKIADSAQKSGITRCITSFLDIYQKVKKRARAITGFSFVDIETEKKINLILEMETLLKKRKIRLSTCCENDIIRQLPEISDIKSAACISNNLFVDLFGGRLSVKKDPGQRIKDGCGCHISVDIGSYRDHPCLHNCLFCYANPSTDHEGAAF